MNTGNADAAIFIPSRGDRHEWPGRHGHFMREDSRRDIDYLLAI